MDLFVGYSNGIGTYNLSGTGVIGVEFGYVGFSGTGAFTQSGGTYNATQSLYVGRNPGGMGTYNLSGSGLLVCPNESVGDNSNAVGTFLQTGGTCSLQSFAAQYSVRCQRADAARKNVKVCQIVPNRATHAVFSAKFEKIIRGANGGQSRCYKR